MSIKVALDELAAAVTERGAGYLLTAASTGGRPHVMHVSFDVEDGGPGAGAPTLRAKVGRSAVRNITAEAAVTLLWPQDEEGGYSLIVDATATTEGDPEGDTPPVAVITPTDAVLHRPAP